MNLNFIADPELAPRPREEIRIESVGVASYPDGRRVKIELELTPFAPVDRPNLEITTINEADQVVGSVSVIETVNRKLSLTTPLREPEPHGRYQFKVELFYSPETVQDTATASLLLPDDIPSE